MSSTDPTQPQPALRLPESLLYAIGAGIGGSGLNAVALESLRASQSGGFLGRAVALANQQSEIPSHKIVSLRYHPVKVLSFLPRPNYTGAKRQAVDRRAARELANGPYDFFHGWSGDCLLTLREAARRSIPSVLEIPTWHRNKGNPTPRFTQKELARAAEPFPRSLLNRMLVSRQRVLDEYDLATRILVLSEKARETFLSVGIPAEKLFMMHRGVDPGVFTPAESPPEKFRAIFVGALIRRKGLPVLLEAWRKAALPNSELILVGGISPEIGNLLTERTSDTIHAVGQHQDVASALRSASIHVFPSELEGSAKVTYEAAACGLPQITTREAGDVVLDQVTGWIIPPRNVEALVEALRAAHADPARLARMGAAARQRILENFTWDHFRARLLLAYSEALTAHRAGMG